MMTFSLVCTSRHILYTISSAHLDAAGTLFHSKEFTTVQSSLIVESCNNIYRIIYLNLLIHVVEKKLFPRYVCTSVHTSHGY